MMAKDYQLLYEEELKTRVRLEEEFSEYRESSNEIEELLEKQLSEVTQLLNSKDKELKDSKERILQAKSDSEKYIRQLERELESLRQKYEELLQASKNDRIKLVQQENESEYLESQNRQKVELKQQQSEKLIQRQIKGMMLEAVNQDLEQKIDSILEELALLQTELEENHSIHNRDIENIERLKQQIRDTESELFAQQMKGKSTLENQENNNRLSNCRTNELSIASTASTVSTQQNSNCFNHNNNAVKDCKPLVGDNHREIDSHEMYKRSIKKSRTGGQNLTYSFNAQQIKDFSKLYIEDQKLQRKKEIAIILQQSPQISEKNSSASKNSSGQKEEEDEMDALQQQSEGIQRGRRLTSFSGKHTERYSEARRRLQEKIIKEKISIYDSNINSLQLTECGFNKSLHVVSNLIKDLGDKIGNIRDKKALLAAPRKSLLALKKL